MFSVDVASTFQGVESDGPTIFAAKYEPWLQETLSGFGNGIRRPDSERIILWCNYVTQGVMSARLNTFCLEQLTQLCHANPRTCTGIVLLPNRAGDLRSSPTKQLGIMFAAIVLLKLANMSNFCALNVWKQGVRMEMSWMMTNLTALQDTVSDRVNM